MPGGFDFGSIGGFLGPVGSFLGGLGGFLGGGRGGTDIGAQQQFSMQQLQMEMAFQREMAQNGISWRVQDAKNAGISPLAALGAPTFSPTVSAPPVDYSPSGGGGSFAAGFHGMGQALQDIASKVQTADMKADLVRKQVMFDKNMQEKDMDIALKGAQLARINKLLQTPSFPSVGGGDGLVKIQPDKVTSRDPNQLDVTAGTHSSGQKVVNPGEVLRDSPTDPAIINNPSITNPWVLRYGYDLYNSWFDRNITNPLRSVFGMPPYVRGNAR